MTVLSAPLRRAGVLVFAFVAFTLPFPAAASSDAVTRYAAVLHSFNPVLSAAQSQDMAAHVLMMSSYYRLDPRLLVAIVGVESGWQSQAVSHAGARGLGQLMPETADGLGVLPFDAYENLDGTARYLRRMIAQHAADGTERRYTLALASYNAGPGAVARYGGIPPIAETQAYVVHVMALWHRLEAQLPESSDALTLIARTTARATTRAVSVAVRLHPPGGSVAQFAALDAASMQAYVAEAAAAATPQPKTLNRWFARAFGIAKK
jgi:Transglycosylase SLT domain